MKYIFDLPIERGGRHVSDTIPEAILWANDRAREWDQVFRGKSIREARNVAALGGSFTVIADDLQRFLKNPPSDRSMPALDQSRLVCRDSPVGVALQKLEPKFGLPGMAAAAASLEIGPDELDLQMNEQAQAVLLFWHFLDRYRVSASAHGKAMAAADLELLQRDAATARSEFKEMVVDAANLRQELKDVGQKTSAQTVASAAEVQRRFDKISQTLEKRYERLAGAMDGVGATLQRLEPDVAEAKAENARSISEFAAGLKSEYAAWVLAQQEHGRLEAPARLWASRARLHTKAANRQRWVILIAGAAGLALTVAIAKWAFGFAGSVFIDAATDRLANIAPAEKAAIIRAGAVEALRKGEAAQLLRPTLHLEAIFAGAVTLLWLTMYVWAMRLLVKVYTTEKHLAINASGRSAMVTTYLGLIKQQAANEADRPIVLSAIFEPLKDGFVNDEGPPQISAPAVLSAFLSSKGANP